MESRACCGDDKSGDTDRSRRGVLKIAGSAATAGAPGSLAGCAGNGGGGDGADSNSGGGTTAGDEDGASKTKTTDEDDGGGQETVSIQFLSAAAAENAAATEAFQQSMKSYDQQHENVEVTLQRASYGDIKNKLSSTVAAGQAPALAEAGSLGLQFFLDGDVPTHGSFVEATEGYPDKWTGLNQQAANFRGEWWSGGACSGSVRAVALRPTLVSQVGVSEPFL